MALKLATNVPQTITFPFGDFKEVEGNYGPQWMYGVETPEGKNVLYATKYLHEKIQEAGIERGTTLTITKAEGPGGKVQWQIVGGTGNSSPNNPLFPEQQQQAAPSTAPATQATAAPPRATIEPTALMRDCLLVAKALHKEVFGADTDPQARAATAHTLFIWAGQNQQPRISFPQPVAESEQVPPPSDEDAPPPEGAGIVSAEGPIAQPPDESLPF